MIMYYGMDGLFIFEEIKEDFLEKFLFMEIDGEVIWNEGIVKNKEKKV